MLKDPSWVSLTSLPYQWYFTPSLFLWGASAPMKVTMAFGFQP